MPGVPTPGVLQYSFPADQWTQLPSLAVPRTNHACTTYSGKVSSTEVTADVGTLDTFR